MGNDAAICVRGDLAVGLCRSGALDDQSGAGRYFQFGWELWRVDGRLSHPQVNDLSVEPSQEEALFTVTGFFFFLGSVPAQTTAYLERDRASCYLVSMPKKVSFGKI